MGFSTSLTLHGGKELKTVFATLPTAVRKKSVRNALSAGGAPVRAAAIANLSSVRDTGILASSIRIHVAKTKHKTTQMAVVGPVHMVRFVRRSESGKWRGVSAKKVNDVRASGVRVLKYDPANYAHLVEFGTKSHSVGKAGQLLTMPDGAVVRGPLSHPGSDGIRFMTRAVHSAASVALSRVNDKLWDGITTHINAHKKV